MLKRRLPTSITSFLVTIGSGSPYLMLSIYIVIALVSSSLTLLRKRVCDSSSVARLLDEFRMVDAGGDCVALECSVLVLKLASSNALPVAHVIILASETSVSLIKNYENTVTSLIMTMLVIGVKIRPSGMDAMLKFGLLYSILHVCNSCEDHMTICLFLFSLCNGSFLGPTSILFDLLFGMS